MNYRYAQILAEVELGSAATKVIDLNIQDPISRIEFGYRPNMDSAAMLRAFAAAISKIELVDGSDVLHSLEGRANQALCIYDRRVPTMNHGMMVAGAQCYATMGIDFGRYLYDPELAFDPTKFRNPQLKITHDETLVDAAMITHYLEIWAHCFDEKVISPIGFLMSKQHYAYSPTADDSYEYIDMPTDHPIRQMLIRGYLADTDPIYVVDHAKLSEDNDKRIPIDCNLEYYTRRMKGVWTLLSEGCFEYIDADGQYDKYVTPTDHCTVYSGLRQEVLGDAGVDTYISGGFVRRIGTNGPNLFFGQVFGYLPHHCIQFPFGIQSDIDDWYDVTRVGSLRLRLQAGESWDGSEISVILQQLRRY